MMNLDQCVARAAAAIDEAIDAAMDKGVEIISGRGATEEEILEFRNWYGAMLQCDRAAALDNIRASLERKGERLN